MREQTIQDLLKAAEKVFNNRETPEEREEQIRREERKLAEKIRKEDREHREKENWKNQRELAQILFAGIKARTELRGPRDPQMGEKEKPKRQALKKISALTAKNRGTGKTSALRGTRREEQPRERKSPLELKFYMQGKTVTREVKTRHPSPSPG